MKAEFKSLDFTPVKSSLLRPVHRHGQSVVIRRRTCGSEGPGNPPLRLRALLDHSELFEHPVDVHHIPVLGKLAVSNAKNVYGIYGICPP